MRRFSTEWAVVNCVEVSACASKRTQQLNPLWRISSGKFLGRTYIADGVYDGYRRSHHRLSRVQRSEAGGNDDRDM